MSVGDPEPQEPLETDCAICFDATAESVALPCSCRIAYCGRCWDRALAHSFRACGQARCPSCRGPVRVDFDPDAAGGRGRLVFGRETQDFSYGRLEDEFRELSTEGDETGPGGHGVAVLAAALSYRRRAAQLAEAREEVVTRLAEQASPVQVRLLEQFGAAQPLLREIARNPQEALMNCSAADLKRRLEELGGSAQGCAEKADLIAALQSAARSAPRLAVRWAAAEGAAPECVCGGALVHVDGRGRARQFLKSIRPDLPEGSGPFDVVLAEFTSNGNCGIICDLCENSAIDLASSLWTCGRGDDTIMHATSYDVCEACFLKHAVGHSAEPSATSPDGA
uniref:RING-type domain-containing protein n=1 Tax=Alexandrium catenella TaxID=2925 RepID=A0A7S1M007_ALECA